MENLSTKINQDIQFVNTESWEVYEHYTVNNKKIQTKLGFFDKNFKYIPTTLQSFVQRRGNFQGHHLRAITEEDFPYIKIDLSSAKYDETNQVYDVTQKVEGMYYDMFLILKEQLNFTASIHKRKDGKWGPITILENGTALIAGIPNSITSGFAEIGLTQMAQTVLRSHVLDILPAINNGKGEVFINPIGNEHISWTTFLNVFTIELWGTLILVAMIISCLLTSIEKIFDVKDQFSYVNYLENLWLAFKANFGGKPSSIHQSSSFKISIFYCLLVGSIVWIAYRAEIISQLSVLKVKKPFDSLEDLSKSNYRQVKNFCYFLCYCQYFFLLFETTKICI